MLRNNNSHSEVESVGLFQVSLIHLQLLQYPLRFLSDSSALMLCLSATWICHLSSFLLAITHLVFDMGRGNQLGIWIWISQVRIPMTFLVSAALPVPLSIKPVPATAGFDYKSCVGDCWSNSTSSISRYVVLVSNSSHAIVLVKYIPISMDQVSVSIPGQNPSKSVPVVWGTGFDGYGYRWLKFYPRVTRVKH